MSWIELAFDEFAGVKALICNPANDLLKHEILLKVFLP